MQRQSGDDLSANNNARREKEGTAKHRKKKPYTCKALPNVMLLRLMYFLNKTINTGIYAFRHDTALKPSCVILAGMDRKSIVITHNKWKRMLQYFKDVTVCLNKKTDLKNGIRTRRSLYCVRIHSQIEFW